MFALIPFLQSSGLVGATRDILHETWKKIRQETLSHTQKALAGPQMPSLYVYLLALLTHARQEVGRQPLLPARLESSVSSSWARCALNLELWKQLLQQ